LASTVRSPWNDQLSAEANEWSITRGARFTIVAGLVYWFGEPIRVFVEKRLELTMFIVLGTIVAGFLLARYAF